MAALWQAEVILSEAHVLTSREDLPHVVEVTLVVMLVCAARQDLVELLRAGHLLRRVLLPLMLEVLAEVIID